MNHRILGLQLAQKSHSTISLYIILASLDLNGSPPPKAVCHRWIDVAHWKRPDIELKSALLELSFIGNK